MKSIFELIEPKNSKKKSIISQILTKLNNLEQKVDFLDKKITNIEEIISISKNIEKEIESLKQKNTQELESLNEEIEINKDNNNNNNNSDNENNIGNNLNNFETKESIKNKIIEQIENKEIKTIELKKIFVDENNFCSKATFYRYIKDLVKEGKIICLNIKGESIVFKNSNKINNN